MIVKLIFIVLLVVGLFSISLLISYEGFQTNPNLRTQQMPLNEVLSNCSKMNSIMNSNDLTYEQVIRLINNNQINSVLDPNQVDMIEQCLHGKLPELSSYLIPQKIGFVEGYGFHDAKGKAKIIQIEKNSYLRIDSFEIGYEPKQGADFQIPELHVYLSQNNSNSPEIYLDKLKTKLGGKNYKLPDIDLNKYNTVVIYDQISNEIFAKIKLDDPSYIQDSINTLIDDSKNVVHPKLESQIIFDRYGFFEGLGSYQAKGIAIVDYEEDEGELEIENFEISAGDDLRLYLTKNGDVKKNGYWTIDIAGFVYIASGNTDQILRYSPDGTFKDVFVKSGSGGLALPTGITFGPDSNLYVSSGNTDQILRYSPDGTFKDVFVKSGSGGLDGPKDLTFGPDSNLYVISNNTVLRFDGQSGKFIDTFVKSGSGGLALPTGITFGPDSNLYVSSGNTDQILRYSPDGTFKDVFVKSGSGGLDGPKDLKFSTNGKYLYVASFLTDEILRFDSNGNYVDDIIGAHNGQILNPKFPAFGPDGNLYVSENDAVLRFDGQSGKFIDTFVKSGSGGLALPTGITFGPDSNLYVSSGNTDQILRYSPDGTFKDVFVKSGSGGLALPTGITFGPDSNLYVSSGNTDQILRYSPDGTFKDVYVDSGILQSPHGITFGPDRSLYITSTTDELLRYDEKTNTTITVFASGGGLSNPIDVSVGDDDLVYVSSKNTDQILRYSPDGTFKDVYVDSGILQSPHGITFGSDGILYVSNGGTNEIFKINQHGKTKPIKFVTDASDALYQPKYLEVFDNKICTSSYLTNDIYCYDEETGESSGKLTVSFNRSLISIDNSVVGPDGELYVSDNLRNQILRYDGITGLFSDVVINTENDQLRTPTYLTFGPDSNLYVSSENKILRFNGHTGEFIDILISENTAGIQNPQGISFDDDYVYVSSYDNNRVLKYDFQTGEFVNEFISSRDNDLLNPVDNIINNDKFYVASELSKKILTYDLNTGKFLSQLKLHDSPHGLAFDSDETIYVSLFNSNKVISYNLSTKQSAVLLSGNDNLVGPQGLAVDSKNDILYVSSSGNNQIFQYDLQYNTSKPISVSSGTGILQKPQGLTVYDGNLFIANNNSNEILKYIPQHDSLDVFVQDTGDLIRPSGITFGPDSGLYVINENDHKVYQYDVEGGTLLRVFAESPFDSEQNIGLRSIVFTKNNQYMFVSSPSTNDVFTFDVSAGKYILDFFNKAPLNYPTDLTLTPDGKHLLVINYGDNTVSKFSISGNFEGTFIDPGKDGLTQLRDIRFGHDGNLYVMGGNYGQIFRYDGQSGNYLGEYQNGGTYLGKIEENTLNRQYLLNEIDTRTNNVVLIYDHFLEKPFAKITLQDKVDIASPLNIAWTSFFSNFSAVSEPKLESKEIAKNTGFFSGLNDVTAYGQVITKSVDFTSLITIENFSLNYDEYDYVSTSTSQNIFTPGPNLITCLVPSDSNFSCQSGTDFILLGKLHVNAGDNRYLIKDVNLEKYNTIIVFDKTTESSLATIPLRDYGTLRISGESFLDWIQNDFAVIPLVSIIVMIFPVFFDYTRGAFKIIFFMIHYFIRKPEYPLSEIISNKKISILIPAHNEEAGIRESIQSALETHYPNKEIIVIDDGSKDNTWQIANSFAERGLIKLVHRKTASGSKATALNHGLTYATGDYVLCMDGDTILDKFALKNTAQYFDDPSIAAFSGNVKILAGDNGVKNLLTRLQTYEYMIAIELGRRFTSIFQILLVISGAFGIFKKDTLQDVHSFDKDTFTEDFDLTLKFRKTRGKIKFVPSSMAYTYCPAKWSDWVKQRNRWAYGQFQTLSKNKNILTSRFPLKDKVSYVDMFLLDIVLTMLFPIGLTVLGIISLIMLTGDNLHVLVYPLALVMSIFVILEFTIFSLANVYSRKFSNMKLAYLGPVMTFFYRPYLRMINLRAFLRAYFNKGTSW